MVVASIRLPRRVAVIFEPFLLRQSDRLRLIAVGLAVFGVILWLVDRSGLMNDQLANSLTHSFTMGIKCARFSRCQSFWDHDHHCTNLAMGDRMLRSLF